MSNFTEGQSWRTRRLIAGVLASGALVVVGSAGAAGIALAALPIGGGSCGTGGCSTSTTPPTTAPGAGGLPERLGGAPGGAVSGAATQSPGAVAGTKPGLNVKAATPGADKGSTP
jgi:hypothetical protein